MFFLDSFSGMFWAAAIEIFFDHLSFSALRFFFCTDKRIQHKRAIEKEALKEYWEKRGGEPAHH